MALSVSPSSIFTRVEPQLFRVLLLRRLRISLPFSRRFCRCGRSLDAFGHHHAACSRAGVLGRRGFALEVVADGLPLFGGAQLAVDTTQVSPLHADGSPHRHAADSDGSVLATARRRKERTHPELEGPESRARLVVLAWKQEADGLMRRCLSCACWPGRRSEVSLGLSRSGSNRRGDSVVVHARLCSCSGLGCVSP